MPKLTKPKKLVVIGAGPGGYVAASRAALNGHDVTLIEKSAVGGVCLNEGCIPTKTLLHSAGLFLALKHDAKRAGVLVDGARVDWSAVLKRKTMVVSRLAAGTRELLDKRGVRLIEGVATLKSPGFVEVEGDGEARLFDADAVIVATGSGAEVQNIPGFDSEGVITSKEALSLEALPRSVIISGGGAIGMEFAYMYAAFGVAVTVAVSSSEILRNMDSDCAAVLRSSLEKKGVTFYLKSKITGVSRVSGEVSVNLETPLGLKTINAEKLLVAKGRRPNTQGLGLEHIGVADENGMILTDAHMETNIKGVYAIGDCANHYGLAHVASREADVAVNHISGLDDSEMNYGAIPVCVYTSPQIASVGLTEREAAKKGIVVQASRFPLSANGRSVITGDTGGFVKILAAGRKILGVHMAGGPATDMIAEAVLAMSLGASIDDLARVIHSHPTVSEALGEAAENVFGVSTHGL
ncbi:dihydrolipoyl dehydrogenase [Synergistales bacterium]|nr:dihydrolipoyl dehydrogenase [Synergistales bacterium]